MKAFNDILSARMIFGLRLIASCKPFLLAKAKGVLGKHNACMYVFLTSSMNFIFWGKKRKEEKKTQLYPTLTMLHISIFVSFTKLWLPVGPNSAD